MSAAGRKKGSGRTSITYDEAVEVALTFGWIDGQARADGRWDRAYESPRTATPYP